MFRRASRARIAGCALVVAAAGAWSASARAATLPLRPIAESASPVVADGKSLVAVRLDDLHVLTIDAAGRRRKLTLSRGCSGPLLAAGADRVLVGCTPTPFAFYEGAIYNVINARTRRVAPVFVPNPYKGSADGATPSFSMIGDDWIGGRVGFHQSEISFHANWRTGRQVAGHEDPFGSRRWLDLSSASLGRPLCRPFSRPRGVDSFGPSDRYADAPQVDQGWVLTRSRGREGFTYGRCGAPTRTVGRADAAVLGGGAISWIAPRRTTGPIPRPTTTFVRRLHDGRTWTIGDGRDTVVRAGRTIVVFRSGSNVRRVRLARLPR